MPYVCLARERVCACLANPGVMIGLCVGGYPRPRMEASGVAS